MVNYIYYKKLTSPGKFASTTKPVCMIEHSILKLNLLKKNSVFFIFCFSLTWVSGPAYEHLD